MSTSTSSSIKQAESYSNWSELPVDLLEMVAKKLTSIEDLYSLGGVCHSWRYVGLSIRKSKNKTLPWLMLTANYTHTHRDFFSVAENKTYTSNYPKAFYDCQCWGSPFGWLVTFSFDRGLLHLLNPFSPLSPRLSLPPLWTFGKSDLSSTRRSLFIYKAVVVLLHSHSVRECNYHNRFLVFVIYGLSKNLAYSRPGDKTWTTVSFQETTSSGGQEDILQLNGQYYSVDSNGSIWLLCDVAADGPNPPTAIPFASPPPMNELLKKRCGKSGRTFSLLEMDAELHLAVRFQHRNTRKTLLIEIFKCDASTCEWQKLTTLGGYVLFLGTCTSISVKASGYSATNCTPGCIYYCYDDYKNHIVTVPPDIGIIDVTRREIMFLNVDDKRTCHFSAPAWVVPTLL
ncbi:hypothetical protein FRX31_009094 [Thalictrum thalictroides]|uniref:KIB1-4 beta-propeller domain-containing protein n=1 Tax=Thalictrum thalictroides TaxID=46969 RepID=A0A7J6WWN2_THATH|nr:hypothetical protein FRX31_009094 [Thalictrum thalictroides]